MSKSRPVGKPAKLAGSGRKFVRSCFTEPSHLEENESLNISKEICFGLAIFRATFGCDDTERVCRTFTYYFFFKVVGYPENNCSWKLWLC